MSWRDQLQKASFRGVPFEVDSDDGTFGRRGQLHEFPQRDKPYHEDLGRRAREFNLVGFVIGENYMTARDNILGAVEQVGPGELVHPWYGRMMVSVQGDVRVNHSNDEGGMCRISFSFIESGEVTFPSATSATGTKSLLAVDALEDAAKNDFAQTFSVEGLPEFAVENAVNTFSDALANIDGALSALGVVLSDPISALTKELGALVYTPLTLANRFFGTLNKVNAVLTLASGISNFSSLNFLKLFSTLNLVKTFNTTSSNASTPTRSAMRSNYNATQSLIREALLGQTAAMSSLMVMPVYDDAVQVKAQLLTALDDESALTSNDVTYLALVDLRAKSYLDINQKIQSSVRLQSITPKQVTPALVLAYDIYENVGRETEIVARNKLRHPGFTPAENIKVLSA